MPVRRCWSANVAAESPQGDAASRDTVGRGMDAAKGILVDSLSLLGEMAEWLKALAC